MKKAFLLLVFCAFAIGAIATSTPSGTKEKQGRMEVTPGMATPAPSTLQGEMTDDMLAEKLPASKSEEVVAVVANANEIDKSQRSEEKVVHFKSKKKENRFLKRVEKVRDRIFRRNEGGSPVIGILGMVFGILGLILLFMSAFVAILATGGLVVFILSGIFGLAGLVLGAVGLGGDESGRPFAVVGLVLGIITTVIFLIVFMIIALIAGL